MKQLLLLPLLLFCAPAFAQSSTATEHLPLTFCGISLDNTAAAFADLLSAKGFKPETAPLRLPISKGNATFRGRFENIPCIVEVGKNHADRVDTVRVFFLYLPIFTATVTALPSSKTTTTRTFCHTMRNSSWLPTLSLPLFRSMATPSSSLYATTSACVNTSTACCSSTLKTHNPYSPTPTRS